ncbi:MAG: L-lactate dehydrogenase [Fusobacteriaceae bacterium]|jgi:L-lactate dehydrogenase|nr:L-lactate dehydrogenase [Fusobacteriaceae bacterium]
MNINTRKIGIIGAGHVGSHCAFSMLLQGTCDEIVLVDVDKAKAVSQAADCMDTGIFLPHRTTVRVGEISDLKDMDMVIISVGKILDEGRLQELKLSVSIVSEVIPELMKTGFDGLILVITNPVDIVTYYVQKLSGLPTHRVIGTGTGLDSARLKKIISEKINIDPHSVEAYMIGEHGDSQFAALSSATIGGKLMTQLMKEKPEIYGSLNFEEISERAAMAGWEVYNGKKSTEFGIACTLTRLVNAIYHDEKKILPCSAFLNGEYGHSGVYAGVPAVIGKNGIEYIVELPISDDEKIKLDRTIGIIKNYAESTGV